MNYKKTEKMAEELHSTLVIIECYCEYIKNEDTETLLPAIRHLRNLSDELYYAHMKELKCKF